MGKKATQEKYIMGEKCFHKFGFRPTALAVFRQKGMLTPAEKGKGYLVCELQKLREQTDELLKDYVFLAEIRRQWGLSREDLLSITRRNQFPETIHIIGHKGSVIKKNEWLAWEAKHKELLITKQKLRKQKDNPDPSLLDFDQAVAATGYSKETLWAMANRGQFPKPVVKAKGTQGMLFRKVDVMLHMQARQVEVDGCSEEWNAIFSHQELRDIIHASKLLECSVDCFIKEAALYKAKVVNDRV